MVQAASGVRVIRMAICNLAATARLFIFGWAPILLLVGSKQFIRAGVLMVQDHQPKSSQDKQSARL